MSSLSKGDLIINQDAELGSKKSGLSANDMLERIESFDPKEPNKIETKSNTVIPVSNNDDGSLKYTFDNIYQNDDLIQVARNYYTVRDNITSFDDYVKELMVFFKNNFQNKALTMSGFLQSNKNSIFTSGLAFSIADIDFDDDNKKYTQFMSTPSFEFYKKVLLNKGFKIWKHCPYVIVADIGSPAITRYLNTNIEDT